MTKCLCGGTLVSRLVTDERDGATIREDYCEKCGKVNDRQFQGYPDIHFKHDCIHPDKECCYKFGTKCGGHSTYPEGYEFSRPPFVCVHDIKKKKKVQEYVSMDSLR